jgi:hypothetical protein
MQPHLEQLEPRLMPSALFDTVNAAWQSLALGLHAQPALMESSTLDGFAAQWAIEADGLGGDGRELGPQNELINGWWIGAEIQTTVPQLVAGPGLIHGSPLKAGVGQSGDFLCLITGIAASDMGTMPAPTKGTML